MLPWTAKCPGMPIWLRGPQQPGHSVEAACIAPKMALAHRIDTAAPAACRDLWGDNSSQWEHCL